MENGWLYYGVIPMFAAGVSFIIAGIVGMSDLRYERAIEQNGVLRPILWIVALAVCIVVFAMAGRLLWSML